MASGSSTASPWPARPRTIVIGLGNALLGDDGVGCRVADEVRRALAGEPSVVDPSAFCGPDGSCGPDCLPDVEVVVQPVGGIALMERLAGYESAVIVDAAIRDGGRAGEVRRARFDEVAPGECRHLDSAHDMSFAEAMTVGQRLGAGLPHRIYVVTVQATRVHDVVETLTPEVDAAIPAAAAAVLDLLVAVAV